MGFVFLPSGSSWIAIILRFFHTISRRKKLFLLIPVLVIQTWKCLCCCCCEGLCGWSHMHCYPWQSSHRFQWEPGCPLAGNGRCCDLCGLWQQNCSEPRDWKTTHKNVEKHITKTSSYHICGPGNNFRGSKQCQWTWKTHNDQLKKKKGTIIRKFFSEGRSLSFKNNYFKAYPANTLTICEV